MATEQVAEVAADHIEDVAEHIEDVAEVTRRISGREINFSLLGLGVGLLAGHFLSGKYWRKKYEEVYAAEIEGMREHYLQKLVAAEDKKDLDTIVKEQGYESTASAEDTTRTDYRAAGNADEQEEVQESSKEVQEEAEVTNVFTTNGDVVDTWDYNEETLARTPDKPYVIHVDEYKENATNYDQLTYTWWETDEIMTADHDEVVDEVDRIVGMDNLKLFGHGSGQKDVVYIRNDQMSMDIEILRSDANYGEVVHGLEIKHSERMRSRPRRYDDD